MRHYMTHDFHSIAHRTTSFCHPNEYLYMKVIFSHDKGEKPNGFIFNMLSGIVTIHGHQYEFMDYTDIQSPDQQAFHLTAHLERETEPFILVGAGVGGYASLLATKHHSPQGIFLLAPALYMPGFAVQEYPSHPLVAILHSWSDTVVPVENSEKYLLSMDRTDHIHQSLTTLEGDHGLKEVMFDVYKEFESFLLGVTCGLHIRTLEDTQPVASTVTDDKNQRQ